MFIDESLRHSLLGFTAESIRRNRTDLLKGRKTIVEFFEAKWNKEGEYFLITAFKAFTDNKVATCFPMNGKISLAVSFALMTMKIGVLMKAVIYKTHSRY
jgi:hypothetical protein